MFDFKSTEAAQEATYLKPGVYTVRVTAVKAGEFPNKKTPFLGVTFTTEAEVSIEEKFPLSEKALGRLQYFHEAWTNKKLDKIFKTVAELESYFTKTFVNPKAGTRSLIVGGEINGKVTYAALPYTGFIAGDDSDLELGEFTEDDENWRRYVKKSNRPSESTGKVNGILNDEDDKPSKGKASKKDEEDDSSETPW